MGDEKTDEKDRWAVRAWQSDGYSDKRMSATEARGLQDILNELTTAGYGIEHIDYERNFVVGKRREPDISSLLLQKVLERAPRPEAVTSAEVNEGCSSAVVPEGQSAGVMVPFVGECTTEVVCAITECASALGRAIPLSMIEKQTYDVVAKLFKDKPIQAEKTLTDLPTLVSGHQRMFHDGQAAPDCPSEKAALIFTQQIQRFLKANPQS
jgi:hypothetical protein